MPAILHLAIPRFPIAVARVARPELRERPVAIAPAHSDRALLVAASAEAEQDGVWPGMPLHRALRRCPRLQLLLPDPVLLGRASQALERLVGDYTPVWEPAGGGRLFLDLSGSSRLLGPGRDAAARLDRDIRQRFRLDGQVGVAGNKLVSRIAAGYLHRPGVCDVFPGSEGAFIAPLPITLLPGIGHKRQRTLLDELNLRQISELARLDLPQLAPVVGPFAPLLYQRARGIDFSPVTPRRTQPRISAGSILPRSTNSELLLQAELCRQVEECGLLLRQRRLSCQKLQLCLDYIDGVNHCRTLQLTPPTCDDSILLIAADSLLQTCRERRTQVRAMRFDCLELLSPTQLSLFDAPRSRHSMLQEGLDQLRSKYGLQIVQRGRALATVSA